MAEIGRRFDFPEEPFGAEGGGQLGSQNLHRHLAAMLQVFREVHRGHAAFTKLALEAIAVGEGGGEALGGVRHRSPWLEPRLGGCH